MLFHFLRNVFRKRRSFDDGSFIEFLNREGLLYAELDGHRMAVTWWFGRGLGNSRVLYEGDVDFWLPPHQAETVTPEKRSAIIRKIADYCEQRGISLEIKPGTSRLSEQALAERQGTIESTEHNPEWFTADPDTPRPWSFPDGTSMELMRDSRVLYREPDGHALIFKWTLVEHVGKRKRIRLDEVTRWEAPFEGDQVTAGKLDEIRRKLALYVGRKQ